ncbi:hypothetical protein EJ06DRAFT_525948 [Trichodelitschia bisporula]|uniref:Glycosyltransferase 2-like domain-containing protein n=1 Tax=Trichodelitschia bisporula TaxID=703511 RepID=A0A6G1IB79_9PEZI|nr:hypothetical protein EJ06DRAFT_525948 [Trichodelitschia bisporula]
MLTSILYLPAPGLTIPRRRRKPTLCRTVYDTPRKPFDTQATLNLAARYLRPFILTLATLITLLTYALPHLGTPIPASRLDIVLLLAAIVPARWLGWVNCACLLLPLNLEVAGQPLATKSGPAEKCTPTEKPAEPPPRLLLCLVTRGRNASAVHRSVAALLPSLSAAQSSILPAELHIVTEPGTTGRFHALTSHPYITLHVIPDTYLPPVAQHKARALSFFLSVTRPGADDWILHLDEETVLDAHALAAARAVAARGEVDMAQGVLQYNAYAHWSSSLWTVADCARAGEDWGRYSWQCVWAGRSVWGLHGSWLLVRGGAECEIGWETGCLAEDYWFGVEAQKRGYKLGWIPAIAREQPPTSLADFVRQRRRWAAGLWSMGEVCARVYILTWAWGLAEGLLRLYFLASGGPRRLPWWLLLMLCLENGFSLAGMAWGVLVQDYDAGLPWGTVVRHCLLGLVIGPLVGWLGSFAAVSALLVEVGGFYVIQK